MEYSLAKQLKDAGFPQRIKKCDKFFDARGYEAFWLENEDLEFHYPKMDAVKIPTLSELIEACGDGFRTLNKNTPNGWYAFNSSANLSCFGTTPEEAVAKFWLALKELPSHPSHL